MHVFEYISHVTQINRANNKGYLFISVLVLSCPTDHLSIPLIHIYSHSVTLSMVATPHHSALAVATAHPMLYFPAITVGRHTAVGASYPATVIDRLLTDGIDQVDVVGLEELAGDLW